MAYRITNKMYVLNRLIIAFFAWALFSSYVIAETYVNKTRLIIHQASGEESLSVINDGEFPVLMQLWIDQGEEFIQPEKLHVPFLVLPPVFRLDAKQSRAARVLFSGDKSTLPNNKESLFWLNVLEIPPKPTAKVDVNVFQMAFRTRIKIFYRPSSLAKLTLQDAVKKVTFSATMLKEKPALRIENPSPMHITLIEVRDSKGKVISKIEGDGMIAPFSKIDVLLDDSKIKDIENLSINYVDDYGVITEYKK